METDGKIKIIKSDTFSLKIEFENQKIPTKFPAVDTAGDVWLDDTWVMFKSDDESNRDNVSKEEEKIYWRYHKAWKLMNN